MNQRFDNYLVFALQLACRYALNELFVIIWCYNLLIHFSILKAVQSDGNETLLLLEIIKSQKSKKLVYYSEIKCMCIDQTLHEKFGKKIILMLILKSL
jgi:hypothetical protein